MHLVSERFRKAVKHSHNMAVKCSVYDGTDFVTDLELIGGNVNIDSESTNRRNCTIELAGTPENMHLTNEILHPSYNYEFHPHRGIRFNDGTEELIHLGIFNVEDTDIEDSGESVTIKVKGFDRSKSVQRRRFTDLYHIEEGRNYATAIQDLINDAYPGLTYNFTNTTHITPSMVLGEGGWSGGGDPWSKALEMAEAIGMELFFDHEGAVRLRPVPDPKTAPVVEEYVEGEESILLHLSKSLTREHIFNHVVVIGNHSGLFAPLRADAVDDDPDSPTYVNGPFGDIPTFHRSTKVFSQQQAQDLADAQLLKHLGTPESIRFIGVTNPAHHDAGDVIRIKRNRINVNSVHVIDKINIPLTYDGSMNCTVRERRV